MSHLRWWHFKCFPSASALCCGKRTIQTLFDSEITHVGFDEQRQRSAQSMRMQLIIYKWVIDALISHDP